jgi:SAM-dependent methyltransferase
MDELEKRALTSDAWRLVTQRAILPWVLRFADLPVRADVLEIGCGAGYNAEMFCDRYPGWHFTAADIDPDMVARARDRLARFSRYVDAEVADATALPFEDDSFDLVISIGVWHHVGSWEKALIECARVLRPGAWLLLVDLLPGFFKGPLAKLFPPPRAYTIGELREQLGAAGFARFRLRAAGTLWYRMVAETPRPGEAPMRTDEPQR